MDPVAAYIKGIVMPPDERRRLLNMIVGIPLGLFLTSAMLFAAAFVIGK